MTRRRHTWFHKFRSALTGRYVSRDEAERDPAGTVEELEQKRKPDVWAPPPPEES